MTDVVGAGRTVTHPVWPSLSELCAALNACEVHSVDLVAECLRRIDLLDHAVNAVLAVNPAATAEASACDTRLAAGSGRPLEGVPVLVKDNIGTAGLATTAGSRTLAGTPPIADAAVVVQLRAAGAVVLGKSNLSEWGNFRSIHATEGWSTVGGQTRNPHRLDRTPWGSSSGSAAAVACGMVPLALGTETDGSIVGPAAACGVVGVKPAPGELPGSGIVPVTPALDTPGLLAGTVPDGSLALAAITGEPMPELAVDLAGRRVALWPGARADDDGLAFTARIADGLRARGAEVVPAELVVDRDRIDDGLAAMVAEFAPALAAYLQTRPGAPSVLAAVLAANRADPVALSLFGQDLLEAAAAVTDDERARAAHRRRRARAWAAEVLDTVLAGGIDCVVAPTGPPAWPIDPVHGDPAVRTTSTVPALAGRPVVAVPAGHEDGLPVGVSVFGPVATSTVLTLASGVESAWPRPGQGRPPPGPHLT